MKLKRLTISVLVLALAASVPTLASEIYKWTDAEGNVHYEDRPTGESNEERLSVTYKRTDRAVVQARIDSRQENQALRQEARQAEAEDKKTAEEQRAEAEDRQAKCESYRARLETFVTSRRLYREDENGERVYLDDKETQEARQRAEELVAEYCGS
jgi:hypothetical protein